jgi:hypothetical protein
MTELEKFEEWTASEGINVWAFSESKDVMTACWSAWMACAESKDKDIQMFKKVICDLAETHGSTRWGI